MRKLIERIEKNASAANPAASRMLGNSPVSGESKSILEKNLNEDQLKALNSALGRNLTFIWGPPGTGKTHTIGTIAEYLYRDKNTVLIVSHTNTAVDQAVKHVATAFKEKLGIALLQGGILLRIGDVRDEVLKSAFPEVLVKNQVERQFKELVEKREQLASQKQGMEDELNSLNRQITIIEWISGSVGDIRASQNQVNELHEKEHALSISEQELSDLTDKQTALRKKEQLATRVLSLKKELSETKSKEGELQQKLDSLSSEISTTTLQLHRQKEIYEIAKRIEPLRKELASYTSIDKQKAAIAEIYSKISEHSSQIADLQTAFNNATKILEQSCSSGAMMRLWKRLPKPEEQQIAVNTVKTQLDSAINEKANVQKTFETYEDLLIRTEKLAAELSKYSHISDYAQETANLEKANDSLSVLNQKSAELKDRVASVLRAIATLQAEIDKGITELSADPNEVLADVSNQLKYFSDLNEVVKSIGSDCRVMRSQLTSILTHMLECLTVWGLVNSKPTGVEGMLLLIKETHAAVGANFASSDLYSLNNKAGELRVEIFRLSSEISEIEDNLSQVEKIVIAKAAIIGATLTKIYLSDDIQGRKFDTVIIDEASMAPIPALWVAALLVERNLVIVGDFMQLPPIVLSNNTLIQSWLGRDIFEASGVRDLWEKEEPPEYFIPLTEQRRMLPQIAEIANLFYKGNLKTRPDQINLNDDNFLSWYNKDWPYDNPVLLVDTGSLNAWVTSVVKNGNTSRLNFLSATVSIDIAEQLLLPGRPRRQEGAPKRILIISPYRAHAKLVSILLKENDAIQDDVISGTAHSFQGSEAYVVIFDMVADEPHWRVNLFMPDLDDQLKSLLNVALTRAKTRLIVLGDFNYCQSHGEKAFLGKSLLPFLLKKYPRVDASQIIPEGLASRAAKTQMRMLGGSIEPDSDRIVVTQADFYRVLSTDFSRATNRIVIYSPFITQDRVAFLLPQMQAAASRGITIFILTKSHSERSKTELNLYRKLENQLSEIGAVIIHKLRMHEKLVFIDDNITWSGSLNPLSFSNTQEIMERRKSSSVLQDYFKILRLEELLLVPGKPESKCPICGSEMIAAEGADEPYYWRCANDDCYSRSIDQPYPIDGMLTCGSCNSTVEFGYWGDYPHWRCCSNTRHRQKIFKSHLRLPKMAALVPKSERKKLCRLLSIDDFDSFIIGDTHQRNGIVQSSLFGDDN
ncbi:MAG: AAA family ATPase [Deltaproteobacteria bacterium]|nr:AAA family ATPase [Deltaproteobacteria bacterium]